MRRPIVLVVLAGSLTLGLLLIAGYISKPTGPGSPVDTHSSFKESAVPVPRGATVQTPTTSASPPPHPPAMRGLANLKEINQQDRQMRTRRGERQLHGAGHSRPAYQHLPYRTDEVRIEITNVTSDGRVVLRVIPLGLNVNPRIAYTQFLHRYHDPGSAYVALFARYGQ